MKKARIVVLEGTWWSNHEVPLVLPYFHALEVSHEEIDISHRTIRTVDDIAYYVSRIAKDSRAFLYFACHGEGLQLRPGDSRSLIPMDQLLDALSRAKPGAISFVHFGCCEMVDPNARRKTLQKIINATGARWASGYTKEVDWLDSMFFDLALVTRVFVPFSRSIDGRVARLKYRADEFVKSYEQLARELGFSGLSKLSTESVVFPNRLRNK